MPESSPTSNLLARLRTGDGEAAAELLRTYEPMIRSRIRVWLRMKDTRLRRVFDSMDVCQSVFASFFVRTAAGQFEFENPEQLIALLLKMARNKLAHQVSEQTALRRDVRRTDSKELNTVPVAAPQPSPSKLLAGRELLDQVRGLLSDEERKIADRRGEGLDWTAIANELGGTPDALRMKLTRALDRVTAQLGLDDSVPPQS